MGKAMLAVRPEQRTGPCARVRLLPGRGQASHSMSPAARSLIASRAPSCRPPAERSVHSMMLMNALWRSASTRERESDPIPIHGDRVFYALRRSGPVRTPWNFIAALSIHDVHSTTSVYFSAHFLVCTNVILFERGGLL